MVCHTIAQTDLKSSILLNTTVQSKNLSPMVERIQSKPAKGYGHPTYAERIG